MDFLLGLVSIIGMTLPSALGFHLIFGKGNILHFGPVGVGIVAGYSMFVTHMATHSYMFVIPVGVGATLVVSALFAWLSLRLDGDALGILTIAVHLALLTIVLNWTSVTNGTLGITAIPRMALIDSPPAFALFASLMSCCWIVFSTFSIAVLLAGRSPRSRSSGIPPHRSASINRAFTTSSSSSAGSRPLARVFFSPSTSTSYTRAITHFPRSFSSS